MKPCIGCRQAKTLSEFYAHPGMADGHLNRCKSCCKLAAKAHRIVTDSVRARDRRRAKIPHVASRLRRNAKAWREKYPERYRAHCAVSNAVRDGKLTRGPCEHCGSKGRVHAHHDDYSQPLKVRWLCPRCHALHHAIQERK